MFRQLKSASLLRALLRDRGGNVLIMFAGIAIALATMVGAAVDYSRATEFKAALQNLADGAALAGASAYYNATTGANGVTVATNYWNAGLSKLPPNSGVGTPTITSSSDVNGYYVQVTVPNSTIKTTFLSLVMNSINVAVTAKAKDPIVTANIDFGHWTHDAYDGNTIYWYTVTGNTPPTFSAANVSNGTFLPLFTNVCNSNPTVNLTPSIAAALKIGFAFVNVTGGSNPNNVASCRNGTNGTGYGSNSHGGAQGSQHVFYSQQNPVSSTAYPSITCNGALQTKQVTDPVNTPEPAVNSTGSCLSATTPQTFATPSCAGISGDTWRYYWNDMGAGTDDYDFNDGVYNLSCGTGGTPNTGVILTD